MGFSSTAPVFAMNLSSGSIARILFARIIALIKEFAKTELVFVSQIGPVIIVRNQTVILLAFPMEFVTLITIANVFKVSKENFANTNLEHNIKI